MVNIVPYNGLYNVISVDLLTANNGTAYQFFVNPTTGLQDAYVGYVRVLRADDVCSFSLGSPSNDQIPVSSLDGGVLQDVWMNVHYHLGITTLYITNPASTQTGTPQLQILVTI